MRTLSTTHALQNLGAVSRRSLFKTGPIKWVCRLGLVLFLAALLSPATAWAALPIEAVQRSIQQRWAVANGGSNCTFPNRSDGASPGLYPVDGFYGADLNNSTLLSALVTDIETKVFSNLTDNYVLFGDFEGNQIGINYVWAAGYWRYDTPSSERVSTVISPAPGGSAVDVRLRQAQEALLLCRQMAFWIAPDLGLEKGGYGSVTLPPPCPPPPCGISYDLAADSWRGAAWTERHQVWFIGQIFGEYAWGGTQGGGGGSCFHDDYNLFTRTGRLDANKGDSPGELAFFIAVGTFNPVTHNHSSLATCPVPADNNWHAIDQKSGNGQLVSRWIPVNPIVNDPPPASAGCGPNGSLGDGGWFVYVCSGLFHGQFTDSWSETQYTKNCDKKVGGDECEGDCAGMARYSAHAMLASLNIKDTPLRYSPPRGPAVNFTVTYNQRETQSTTGAFSNLGPSWTFSWLSYVTDDPNTQLPSTPVYLSGGGSEVFAFNSGTQTFAPDPQSNAVLVRTLSNKYERRLPDGSIQVFGPQSNGASSYPRLLFMTETIDPAGNHLTINYDGSGRIASVTDALGQTTTLSYQLPGDSFKITKVTDPFGRFAVLGYANGRLASVTDPVGIQSQFGYAAGTSTISSLTTPYGTSTFASGMSGSTRWLEMTDPMGGKERVEYRDNAPGISATDPTNTVPSGFTNSGLDVANTFYWDKKALLMYPPVAGVYDYTKARITHWAKNASEGITGIVASEKSPLEYRVWSKYAGQSDTNHTGPTANPIQVARILADNSPQLFQYEYNSLGNTTKATDPTGRVMTYVYHSNQIDLHEVRQTRGTNNELLRTLTYNTQHEPLTDTDAAGQVTTNTYNTFGQILTRTNAKGETTSYAYGGSVPTGYLASITSPPFNGSSAVASYTYDSANRVFGVTFEPDQSLVRTYYDDLDRPTYILYADETYEQNSYGALDLTIFTDRTGRQTVFHYNANGQMDSITDPLNRITQYGWCICGSLTSITDPNGNVTTFNRDLQSRVYQKVFADTSTVNYLYEGQTAPNTAGATSRLKSSTDALNRRTNYTYLSDNNISLVTYTNTSGAPLTPPTPSVAYSYDPDYNRIAMRTDGGSQETIYGYYPVTGSPSLGAGRLHTINGPLADDTISFGYDELGRVTNRTIEGGGDAALTAFDSLGRVASTDNDLGHFDREYFGVTPRLKTLSYPNSQTANYAYFGNDLDRQLQTLENLDKDTKNLSKFEYTYFSGWYHLTFWGRQLGDAVTPLERWFEYDDAQQLLFSRNNSDPKSATHVNGYTYDPAGNRTYDSNYNPQEENNGIFHTYTPNNLNEIETMDIQAGILSWEVTLGYDLAGNLIDDGQGKTFEWDAANRLVAINSGSNRSEFSYNGQSRRVKIVEKTGSTVTSTKQFIWVGTAIAQERDANNAVKQSYFAEGEVRGVPGTKNAKSYYYSRDHLGSIREVTSGNGTLEARYDYDPYGQRTKLSGTVDVDFGYTGHYHHAPSGFNLTLYRAYDPAFGRWLGRDPMGERIGVNLYRYVGNSPVSLWDPLGLDAIFLNDSAAVRILGTAHGHGAILVGNNITGWTYYSKDGEGPGRYGDGNNRLAVYPTFDAFYHSEDAARYDRAVYIPTTEDQDLDMTTYGDSHYREDYSGRTNNCGDLINHILGAAGIPGAGSVLGTVRPNSQYQNFSTRPRWTPFPMR